MPRPIGYRAKKPTLASDLAQEAAAPGAPTAVSSTVGALSANATDTAVKLAAEHKLNLADVAGSGVDGRITKADVESHLATLAFAANAAAIESETDTGGDNEPEN
jgi:pyruvate/2-oxoglutarate dehydrogenase complex dihydrolipoamide acyltransferase (E2) component